MVLKKVIVYITLFSLGFHLFYSSGYLLDYFVNTDFYLENCTNKDRPELSCNGQCILMQKMAESQPQNSNSEATVFTPLATEYLKNAFEISLSESSFLEDSLQEVLWYSHYDYLNSYSITHPPEVL